MRARHAAVRASRPLATRRARRKCKLGTVKKLAGATAKAGKVSKQGTKAGAKLAVGTKVKLTLKP
jgi:hypothetical protein